MWPFKRNKGRPAPTYEEALRHSYQLLQEADDESWVAIPIRDILRWHLELGEKVQLAEPDAQFNAALQQIGVSALAAEAFRKAGWVMLPAHPGFLLIVRLLRRQGRYQHAIDAAEEAQRQRWSGDWANHIDACRERLSKHRSFVDPETDTPFIP